MATLWTDPIFVFQTRVVGSSLSKSQPAGYVEVFYKMCAERPNYDAFFVSVPVALIHQFISELSSHLFFDLCWWLESKPAIRRCFSVLPHFVHQCLQELVISLLTLVICYPLTVIQIRLQLGKEDNMIQCAKAILNSDAGIKAFYSGFWFAALEILPRLLITHYVKNFVVDLLTDEAKTAI